MNVQFNPSDFEEMIDRRGRDFEWERARKCPCYSERNRAPVEDCPLCDGLGFNYTAMGSDRATILGIMGDKRFARFGEWIAGDAVMTFPARLSIGDRDRITLTTGVFRETDILKRGTRDSVISPGIQTVLELGDLDGRLYEVGLDFEMVGQQVAWLSSGPPAGMTYSVLYEALPVYVVWLAIPQIRAQVGTFDDDTQEMPRKVALRRWHDFQRPEG